MDGKICLNCFSIPFALQNKTNSELSYIFYTVCKINLKFKYKKNQIICPYSKVDRCYFIMFYNTIPILNNNKILKT